MFWFILMLVVVLGMGRTLRAVGRLAVNRDGTGEVVRTALDDPATTSADGGCWSLVSCTVR